MTPYEAPYTPEMAPPQPESRGRWSLATVFWIDLVIILVAVLLMSLAVTGYVMARAISQGLIIPGDAASYSKLADQQTLNRLLGTGGLFAVLVVQNAIFVAIPILRVKVLRREPLARIGFQARNLPRLIGIGFLLGIVTLVCNVGLSYLFRSAGVQQNQTAQYPLTQGDYAGQIAFFIGAALLAPIGEETLFRGYAFNAFRRSIAGNRGIALAYVVSALLFMLAHALSATQGVIGLLVPAFVMGLLFAWAMHRTESLLPSMIAHTMNNGLALIVLLYCVNVSGAAACQNI